MSADSITERKGQYGSIEVLIGPMKDGKSRVLIDTLEIREQHGRQIVQAFYPHIDNRGKPGTINSTDGKIEKTFPATEVFSSQEIKEKLKPGVTFVAIDEAQFMDMDLPKVCFDLAMMGKEVVVAGLPTDFKKEVFGPMGAMALIADRVTRIKNARCGVCGNEAKWTQRLVEEVDGTVRPSRRSEGVVVVGGTKDDVRIQQESDEDKKPRHIYEPRCNDHHEVLED